MYFSWEQYKILQQPSCFIGSIINAKVKKTSREENEKLLLRMALSPKTKVNITESFLTLPFYVHIFMLFVPYILNNICVVFSFFSN